MQHRVLMVCDFFFPSVGGVEGHIYQLSQCLIHLGHKIVVMTTAKGDRKGVRYLTNGLKVYYLPRIGCFNGSTFPNIYGNYSVLRSILFRERITIVHAHQSVSTMACQSIVQARSLGFKCVMTEHSLFGFADLSGISLNKALKHVLADVHHVICVSHTSKQNTIIRACIPPSIISVIPNAVVAEDFEPDYERQFDPDRITIVAFTRLVYRKGIDLLAVILPEVCTRHPNVRFLICGDGPKETLLREVVAREELQNQVSLLPGVPHSQARSILIKGDVFINASLTEAFCIAIVEAAAAGLLVVSTKVGGVPEVLPEDMMILADPTPDSLLQATEEALTRVVHVDKADQHRKVSEMYSWWNVAERTEAVYGLVRESKRDDSLLAMLERHRKGGAIAGIIFVFLTIGMILMAHFMEIVRPRSSIDVAPDLDWGSFVGLVTEDC